MPPFSPRWVALALVAFAAGLSAACGQRPASADTGRDALLEWAATNAVEVTPEALGRLAGDARVVAIGESAHGVEATLALRNAVFQQLIRHHGFTGVALETGFAESRRIADFVAGGPGEPRDIARTSFTSGFGTFQANADLLAWMREFNRTAPVSKRVRFFGIDLSLGGPVASWATSSPVECAIEGLTSRRVGEAAALRQSFDAEIAPALSRQTPLSPAEQDRYAAFARRLAVAAESARDPVTMRCAAVAEQAGEVSRVTPPPGPGGIPPAAWRSLEARDMAMAENAMLALDQLGPRGRLLVFAHNAHVINEPQRGSHLKALAQPPRSMGQRLREKLGHDLVIVAEAAPGRRADAAELGDLLRTMTSGTRLLDLRQAPSGARGWLLHPQRLRANVDGHAIVTPSTAFDALLVR
jgi:erythromycin esterase